MRASTTDDNAADDDLDAKDVPFIYGAILRSCAKIPGTDDAEGNITTCAVTKVTDTNAIRKIRAARSCGCFASAFCSFRWWVPRKYAMFCLDKSIHSIAYLRSPHRPKHL